MTRIMLDSDQVDVLVSHGHALDVAATYSDLLPDVGAVAALRAKFPARVTLVLIDRGLGDPSGQASVLDVERGARIAGQIPGWYDAKEKAGVRFLAVYANRSNLAAVNAALGPRHAYRWVATLDGTCNITGYVPLRTPAAVQILPAARTGLHADLSLVFESSWHPDPGNTKLARDLLDAQAELEKLRVLIRDARSALG